MVVKASIACHGFEVGDMVWAKMKSQPWWPGHVYNEEFATPLVRQSKKEGLLLVALFGVSSYGWFDPSELIPFDSNYAEKSQQVTSRLFLKAVEDAIREVSRRIGLGLTCMCSNKQNFRTIDVKGFVSVDVAGYDPGAVYSIDAIGKARDCFKPNLSLEFLRQLALEPTVIEHVDVDILKNKATVLAYRKAFYKDSDQAYGYDPVCASIQEPVPHDSSSKAPLSGGEVFALKDSTIAASESTLINGTGRSGDTPLPVLKSNNACFETSTTIVESSTSSSVAKVDQANVMVNLTVPEKNDTICVMELSRVLGDLHSLAVDPFNTVNRGLRVKVRKAFLRFRSLVFQKGQNFLLQVAGGGSKSSEDSVEVPPSKPQGGLKRGLSGRQEEMAAKKKKKVDDIRNLKKEKKVIKIDEPPPRNVKQAVATTLMKTEQQTPETTMLMIKFSQGGSLPSFNELKARFACYGPMDLSATQIFRNTFSCRVVFRHKADAQAACRSVVGSANLFGNTDVECSLKDAGIMPSAEPEPEPPFKVPKEDHHQPDTTDTPPPSMVPAASALQLKSIVKISGREEAADNGGREMSVDSLAKKEDTGVSHVLNDLRALAVDPFNTVNRGLRIKGKKVFLRFRSLVFQKPQNLSLPLAAAERNTCKPSDDSVEVQPVKPQGGQKRSSSDRQDEMAVAKRKKVSDITNLTMVKKIDKPSALDVKQPADIALDVKQPAAMTPGPEFKRAPEPTMLMLKFPQGGHLPSYKVLKAIFARYGPMDHSGTHIFWNTFSCQVVFEHKAHAQAAYEFVVGSSSLFGNTGVKCRLKEVGSVGSAKLEPPVSALKEDHHQPDMEDRPPSSMVPGARVKSILKKSAGEEAAGGGGKGHVKFVLGVEESKKGVHPSVVTSPTGQPATQPSPPPTLLAPPQLPPRSMLMPPLNRPVNTDIAQQMLSLLARCKDVVMNVSSILGYTPYHPL